MFHKAETRSICWHPSLPGWAIFCGQRQFGARCNGCLAGKVLCCAGACRSCSDKLDFSQSLQHTPVLVPRGSVYQCITLPPPSFTKCFSQRQISCCLEYQTCTGTFFFPVSFPSVAIIRQQQLNRLFYIDSAGFNRETGNVCVRV